MNEEMPKASKLPLWLIIFTTLAVMASGFLLYEYRDRLLSILGTNNRGTLLDPIVVMADMPLTDQQGEAWLWQEQAPKWRLLLPFVGTCEGSCRDFLYTSRQVHIRLDKKTQRVKRVFLNLGAPLDDEMNAYLKKEHPYLTVVRGDLADFSALIGPTNALPHSEHPYLTATRGELASVGVFIDPANPEWTADSSRLFLVDQQGVAMMFYTPEHDGSDLLGDLKHLIKYSPEL